MKGSRNFVDLRSCIQNPKCCFDTHDLECPNKFNPPLLSTSTEFCTEALAKGIPIPKCVLAKPKKLQIEREPPPLAKPATSRHLKNWQRWCYIWRQTYNKLTADRNVEIRPPVMSSGEVHRMKKEDKELFDRTLHTYHLTGFYIKNAQFPDSIRPKPCGGNADMKEVVTKRYIRDFPEMKRHRYPNYVRNEVSLPPRKVPAKKTTTNNASSSKQVQVRAPLSPLGFNWEEQWAKTKHVEKMKDMLACDISMYGKTDPLPDNLIFKPMHLKDGGPTEKIYDKNKDNNKNLTDLSVPQLVFSTEPVEEEDPRASGDRTSFNSGIDERSHSHIYYSEKRGPILRIRSRFSELIMTYSKMGIDFPHFIGNPATSFVSADGESTNESTYFYDDDHHFSITTKCKETKFILLKNEGTTAIRYQWFHSPPTYDAQQMLQDPTQFKHIRLETDDSQQEKDDIESIGGATTASQTEGNQLKRVSKKAHLEFHFCSLPGIILPGQSLEFPIIFRSKRPGFFHETLYLLTHPRVVSLNGGKSYAVRLSGVCTDVELVEPGNEHYEMESLKRFLNHRAMEEETRDLMDSILDRALWEATNTVAKGSSLPNGRVTAESIFCSHNRDYYYHFGKSEKALELVHQLIEMLVPIERVETQAHCDLSLQSLYNLVLSAREENDLNWAQLRSSHCEDLLEKLDTECMLTLSEQRTFAWPNTERRKYTACYSNLLGIFDEILLGFDRVYNLYNAPAIKLIDQRKAEQLAEDYLRKEQEKEERAMMSMMEDSVEQIFEAFGETEVDNVPPLTELQVTPFGNDEMTMDEDEEAEEEKIPYWLAAFEEMMRPFNRVPSPPQSHGLTSPEKSQKRDSPDQPDTTTDMDVNTTAEPTSGGSGDASLLITAPVESRRKSTAPTLLETMQTNVENARRQVLTEARVKLFEDVFCAGIERMLATVDNFNNMLDYRETDALVVIDDKC